MTFLADLRLDEDERRCRRRRTTLRQILTDIASRRYDERRQELGDRQFARPLPRRVPVRTSTAGGASTSTPLDTLREGISLSAYGQKDPLVEYKRESFDLFQEMMRDLYKDALTMLFRAAGARTRSGGSRRGGRSAPTSRRRRRRRRRSSRPNRRRRLRRGVPPRRWGEMTPARVGRARSTSGVAEAASRNEARCR